MDIKEERMACPPNVCRTTTLVVNLDVANAMVAETIRNLAVMVLRVESWGTKVERDFQLKSLSTTGGCLETTLR